MVVSPDERHVVPAEPAGGPKQAVSRRLFLKGGLTGAVVAGFSGRMAAKAQQASAAGALRKDRDDLRTLVNHVTQGFSRPEYEAAQALGFEGYLERQLDPEGIEDTVADGLLEQFPTLAWRSKEIFDIYGPVGGMGIVPVSQVRQATILRSVHSKRQLFERVVEFWTNHFSVDIWNSTVRYLKTTEDRDVIRKHALGKFRDLLIADAKSGAMLVYLNNEANVVGNPNENYAREVMELHTLGVDGPYNEHDIQELSRVFTGWKLHSSLYRNYGDFKFVPADHDFGAKTILGQYFPPGGGVEEGENFLGFLAGHPKTADFVSRKLAAWLLSYDPPQALVDRVALTFRNTDGDIKAVIREIMSPQSFQEHHPDSAPKLRRPMHFLTSILRATRPQINPFFGGLLAQLETMGHVPFDWPSPDGYPDSVAAWGSAVLPRWDFASRVFDNEVPGINFPDSQIIGLLGGAQQSQAALAIDDVLTGGAMSLADVQVVQAYIDSYRDLDPRVVREAFALAASSPSFQFY